MTESGNQLLYADGSNRVDHPSEFGKGNGNHERDRKTRDGMGVARQSRGGRDAGTVKMAAETRVARQSGN